MTYLENIQLLERELISCAKEEIINAFEKVIEKNKNLQIANDALNGLCGTQHAEIDLLRTELRIIKQEIKSIHNLK